jgi:hypothetical protein
MFDFMLMSGSLAGGRFKPVGIGFEAWEDRTCEIEFDSHPVHLINHKAPGVMPAQLMSS